MAATVTMSNILDTTQSTQRVRGTIAFTGTYPTGGDTVNLNVYPVQSASAPLFIAFVEMPVATPSGNEFSYVPGTGPSNGKVYITTTSGAQFTPGAYSGGLTGTTLAFEAVFPLGR